VGTPAGRVERIDVAAHVLPKPRRRPGDERPFLPHEIPEGVRVGRGSVIDFDARVGLPMLGPARGTGLRIGEAAAIRGGSSIYMGSRIGRGVEVGFNVVIYGDTVIGNSVRIGANTVVGRGCSIGDRVTIAENCYIAPKTTIQDDVRVAAGVMVADDPHPGSETSMCSRGPTLSRGAQIGTNATVLPFVVIGAYALVGAGSVVTRDVRSGTVVAGNPARAIKNTSDVRCPLDLPNGGYLRVRPDSVGTV
jgi:acetyltransferase-like isoleucine patch superfamily enzyme